MSTDTNTTNKDLETLARENGISPNDIILDKNGRPIKRTGGFVKGVSGNPKGRPKKIKIEDQVAENDGLTEEIKEACATGNAKEVFEELLKTAKTRAEATRLAKELIQYQTPKKASIETKVTDFRKIEFRMVLPDAMSQIEDIYKQDSKLIENMSYEDLNKITNTTATIDVEPVEPSESQDNPENS